MTRLKLLSVGSLVAIGLLVGLARSAEAQSMHRFPPTTTQGDPQDDVGYHVTGTVLDRALPLLRLDGPTAGRVIDALQEWARKWAQEQADIRAKKARLADQIKAETDPAKREELRKKLAGMNEFDGVRLYQSAQAALKGVLTEEQLKQFDELARQQSVAWSVGDMNSWAGVLAGHGVTLSEEQQKKLDAAIAGLKEQVRALPPGDRRGAIKLQTQLQNDFTKSVLTEQQRAKLNAPMRQRPKPDVS